MNFKETPDTKQENAGIAFRRISEQAVDAHDGTPEGENSFKIKVFMEENPKATETIKKISDPSIEDDTFFSLVESFNQTYGSDLPREGSRTQIQIKTNQNRLLTVNLYENGRIDIDVHMI
jgi:hypothetical protein